MKFIPSILLLFGLFAAHPVWAQIEPDSVQKEAFVIGEVVRLHSTILNEKRVLNIYLPESYGADSTKTYPVIYLLDGSRDEDFIHIAGLVQFCSFSWIGVIPESIVVGIGNIDRKRDFTFPSKNEQDNQELPTSGHSKEFVRYIKEELQPFIRTQYRTQPSSTLIGQSLGGLLATTIYFDQPELFDRYIIVSPSLWWDDESLLQGTPKNSDTPNAVYIVVGKEGEVMERTSRQLFEKLDALKHPNSTLFFKYFEHRDHSDALHEAVYYAFEWFNLTEKNQQRLDSLGYFLGFLNQCFV